MYQKDYILRMIEMIRDMILGILGLIRKGELEKAEQEIERLYKDFLKEDSAFFMSVPAEDLTTILLKKHNYTKGHLEILALLFYAEAELALVQENKKFCLELSRKALILFEFINNEQKTYSFERAEKIELIKNRIEVWTEGDS